MQKVEELYFIHFTLIMLRYGEAHDIKEKLSKAEKFEEEKWMKSQEDKIFKKRELYLQKNK